MTSILVPVQPLGFSEFRNEADECDETSQMSNDSNSSDDNSSDNNNGNDEELSQKSQMSLNEEEIEGQSDLQETANDAMNESLSVDNADDASSSNRRDILFQDGDDDDSNADSASQFGGLINLGNTCYLNSALQMIASLDDFPLQILERIPEKGESKLRDTLIYVLKRLQDGETIRPEQFKGEIDERSSLFIGFRQQDSHEFLTTLLDLLDEDYKPPTPPPQQTPNQEDNSKPDDNESTMDEEMEDVATTSASPGVDNENESCISNECSEECNDANNDDSPASPIKKQRLEESSPVEHSEVMFSPPRTQSFKDLNFTEIEKLLYEDAGTLKETTNEKLPKQKEPKCKLVGGRMSTSGASLTPYDSNCVADNGSSTSRMTDDTEESGMITATPKNNSPVDSAFTTEVRVCLTCDSCKYRRSHTETYLHLSLEIGQHCSSLDDGLKKFFAPEKREIKCEKCFCETAMQTSEITKLPRAMLFHLKRFIVDVSPDYTSISYRKDQSPVSFEETISFGDDGVLSEFMAVDASIPQRARRYGIRSVVNHIGSSASCGHYTADAKRLFRNQHREWVRFNDSTVSKISSTNAIDNSSSTAYMLMYEVEP